MDYGSAVGWTLFLSVVCIITTLVVYSYLRRREAHAVRKHQELLEKIRIGQVDQLGWKELQQDCIPLLQARGYKDVRKTREVNPDKGVDITAVSPDECARVAVEVKYRGKDRLQVGEVKKLIGDISVTPYKDWDGILITNAVATREARKVADEHTRITLVERATLMQWLVEEEIKHDRYGPVRIPTRDPGPIAIALTRTAVGRLIYRRIQSMSTVAKVTSAIVSVCCVAVLIVVVQIAAGSHDKTGNAQLNRAHVGRPSSAAVRSGAPDVVAKEFFAAISSHDWLRVWTLGGKNIGRGPYATYPGMVSGYRGTIRDVLMNLKAQGQTVSGEFLAYETGERVSTYDFVFVVRNGVIVSARQRWMGTTQRS